MDQLAEMKDWRPRLEKEIRLPGDSRGADNKVWFFSIDGRVGGKPFKGCLMAGECVMVQAHSFEKANKIAAEGIESTLEFALEFFNQQQGSLAMTTNALEAGLTHDVGGRRGQGAPGTLKTDEKLKAMIASRLGGLPWRW